MTVPLFHKIDTVSTVLQEVKNSLKTRLPDANYVILPQFFQDINDYDEFQRITREIQFYSIDQKLGIDNQKSLIQLKEELHQILERINTKETYQEFYDFEGREFKRLQEMFWDLYRVDEDDGEIVEAKVVDLDKFQAVEFEKNGIQGAIYNSNLKAVLNKENSGAQSHYKRKLASLLPKQQVIW